MARKKKDKKDEINLDEYNHLDDQELSRLKRIGDTAQSVEKAKKQKLITQEASRELISSKSAGSIAVEVFTKLKTILYSSSNKLPAQIVGKNHAEVSQILYEFIDNSLQEAVDSFNKKLKEFKVDENEDDE